MLPVLRSECNNQIERRQHYQAFPPAAVKAARDRDIEYDDRLEDFPPALLVDPEFLAVYELGPSEQEARWTMEHVPEQPFTEQELEFYELMGGRENWVFREARKLRAARDRRCWREPAMCRLTSNALAIPEDEAMRRLVRVGVKHDLACEQIVRMLDAYQVRRLAAAPEWRNRLVFQADQTGYDKRAALLAWRDDSSAFMDAVDQKAMEFDDMMELIDQEATSIDAMRMRRQRLLAAISDKLGVEILGVFAWGDDDPQYAVVIPPERTVVVGGADALVSMNKFRKAIARAGVAVALLKPADWDDVFRSLLAVAERRADPAEPKSSIFDSFADYATHLLSKAERTAAAADGRSFQDETGWYIVASDVKREDREQLRGCDRVNVPYKLPDGRWTNRRYWHRPLRRCAALRRQIDPTAQSAMPESD